MPRNELGYGDVDARPPTADGADAAPAAPTVPTAMNDSGHAVPDETPPPLDGE